MLLHGRRALAGLKTKGIIVVDVDELIPFFAGSLL
jgi:hypothetical protein